VAAGRGSSAGARPAVRGVSGSAGFSKPSFAGKYVLSSGSGLDSYGRICLSVTVFSSDSLIVARGWAWAYAPSGQPAVSSQQSAATGAKTGAVGRAPGRRCGRASGEPTINKKSCCTGGLRLVTGCGQRITSFSLFYKQQHGSYSFYAPAPFKVARVVLLFFAGWLNISAARGRAKMPATRWRSGIRNQFRNWPVVLAGSVGLLGRSLLKQGSNRRTTASWVRTTVFPTVPTLPAW
jgi:hypothetical protein